MKNSRVVTVSNESISFEIKESATVWFPAEGEQFYAPDLLSLMEPVKLYVWHGGPSDYMLLSSGMVFKTPEEAAERYKVLKALIHFMDQQIDQQ